jgi:glycosyltransferase involved in cell wall biosynthesis
MNVIVSCSGKFHAFALAEQLQKHESLCNFFTAFAYQKDKWLRNIVKRIDKEIIDSDRILTNVCIAAKIKLNKDIYKTNDDFDKWVASQLHKYKDADVFIGWSGMSLHSIKIAKQLGMKTILERGSSHIVYQDEILHEEYKNFKIDFHVDSRVIAKELKEYEMADFISIPSNFVKGSFLQNGIRESKLIQNPYGSSSFFKPSTVSTTKNKFRILYLGSITIRKGLIYLFQALNNLTIQQENFDVFFIGSIDQNMKDTVKQFRKPNWKFFGHINHYELANYISQCDVAIHSSIEEGLSMVIPQILNCGIPMIVTSNSGGEDVVKEGVTGYVIPIRDSMAISEKIQILYNNNKLLDEMKCNLKVNGVKGFSWDDYGNRYISNIRNKIIENDNKI